MNVIFSATSSDLIKALPASARKALQREPGAGMNPLRGFQEASFTYGVSGAGVRELPPYTPYQVLRAIPQKNIIVASCINLRCAQVRPFAKASENPDIPGIRVVMRDHEAKPTPEDKKRMQYIQNWLVQSGRSDFEGWDDREDSLFDILQKDINDRMVIGQVAIELRRDRTGNPVDYWIHDAATIKRVIQAGFQADKSQIDTRAAVVAGNEFYDKLAEAKLKVIPPLADIRYVQEIDGKIVAAFTRQDLIFDIDNKRTDVRRGWIGQSRTEQALTVITAFIWGLAYNNEAFNSGTLPKIALAFKDGRFNQASLQGLQDEWAANFRGIYGAWRIPMLNGDVQVVDLYRTPRDMEYMKYLEFCASLIASNYQIDTAELGLRFQQAQNVLSENMDARQKFSKDRGLHDMLGAFEAWMNRLIRLCGWAERYRVEFTGLNPIDPDANAKLQQTQVTTFKKFNEIRAEQDLPPDEYGDIIGNPAYIQYRLQKEAMEQQQQDQQAQEQEENGGGESGELGDEIGDSIDDMFKAARPLRGRTLRTLLV